MNEILQRELDTEFKDICFTEIAIGLDADKLYRAKEGVFYCSDKNVEGSWLGVYDLLHYDSELQENVALLNMAECIEALQFKANYDKGQELKEPDMGPDPDPDPDPEERYLMRAMEESKVQKEQEEMERITKLASEPSYTQNELAFFKQLFGEK